MEQREGRPHNGGVPIEGGFGPGGAMPERLEELTEELGRVVRERPGTALLVAVGIGFLVGRVLRA